MGTRRKELMLWVWLWAILLIMTSGVKEPFTWPYLLCAVLLPTLICLAITTTHSLSRPTNEKERQTEPLFIRLVLKPNEKKKWLVLLVFLALLTPTIFTYYFSTPEMARYSFTALLAFVGVFLFEAVQLLIK